MSLTRKMLSAMDIPTEKIDEIIVAHTDTVNGLKEQIDKLQSDANKQSEVEQKLKDTQQKLKEVEKQLASGDDSTKKLQDLQQEFDEYKKGVEEKAIKQMKTDAYRELLIEAGVSEKRISSVLKVSDVDGIEIGDDGKIKDADKLTENIKSEWADFIATEGKKGADVANPPSNTGGDTFEKMSLNEKMEYANEHPDDASVKAWLGK